MCVCSVHVCSSMWVNVCMYDTGVAVQGKGCAHAQNIVT